MTDLVPAARAIVAETLAEAPLLRFCGTRGSIEEASRRHRMHSALLIGYQEKRLLLDARRSFDSSAGRRLSDPRRRIDPLQSGSHGN